MKRSFLFFVVVLICALTASAQSLTQAQTDNLNRLNLRTIQASVADKANKDFAWRTAGKKDDNQLVITNRRGFLIGAEGGYNFNHGYEAGVKVGYQGVGIRQFTPELALLVGDVKVDGKSYTTYGVEGKVNFEFGSQKIKFFAGPTVGYKYFTVDTGIQIDGEIKNHNQHSNAFTFGVNGGAKIRIGHTTQKPRVSLYGRDGKQHIKNAYSIKNPIYLTVSGSWRAYNIDKPGNKTKKIDEVGIKVGLVFLF